MDKKNDEELVAISKKVYETAAALNLYTASRSQVNRLVSRDKVKTQIDLLKSQLLDLENLI